MSAFVMSHGRNMLVMKIVGYAEDVIRYYKLEEMQGAHLDRAPEVPDQGPRLAPRRRPPVRRLDEALVHNGDFANYHTVSEYLAQRNIVPLFLTDTEVSVLLFDVLNRTYGYPLEYIIEALAPTTERDFELLPEEKRRVYRAIQETHIHGSPDGPWFFIIGRNCYYDGKLQLMGITDTSMLRPQVFALVDGEVEIGLIASEKQAIDSSLSSLSQEFPTVPRYADMYWNARGGSHTDGGAFIMSLYPDKDAPGRTRLICTNKFGTAVTVPFKDWNREQDIALGKPSPRSPKASPMAEEVLAKKDPDAVLRPDRQEPPGPHRGRSQHHVHAPREEREEERCPDGRGRPDPHAHARQALPDRALPEEPPGPEGQRVHRGHPQVRAQGRQGGALALRPGRPAEQGQAGRAGVAVHEAGHRLRRFPDGGRGRRLVRHQGGQGARLEQGAGLRRPWPEVLRLRPGPEDEGVQDRRLRQPGGLPRVGAGRCRALCPHERAGPARTDTRERQAGRLRRCRSDLPLRREGRRGVSSWATRPAGPSSTRWASPRS